MASVKTHVYTSMYTQAPLKDCVTYIYTDAKLKTTHVIATAIQYESRYFKAL